MIKVTDRHYQIFGVKSFEAVLTHRHLLSVIVGTFRLVLELLDALFDLSQIMEF